MLKITPPALKYLSDILGSGRALYINIKKSGCSGLSYETSTQTTMDLNTQAGVLVENVTVIYNPLDRDLIMDTTIDLHEQGLNKHISFSNSQETGRCGCGVSFSIKK